MKLSIIIVSWNTRQLLADCLHSLQAAPLSGESETLVVDNASVDGSADMVRASFPGVHLVTNRENVGFARATNQALESAGGRYALLLNPDTIVRPGALDTLVTFMDAHETVGAVGPRILNPDGTLQVSCFPAPSLGREIWRLSHLDGLKPYSRYDTSRWDDRRPRPIDTLLGACLMVRRAALDQIGLLDETFFMYSEEIDLCQRLARAGWRLFWVPEAEIVHYGGQSSRQVPAESFLRLYRGKVLYFRKHYGNRGARLYKLVLLGAALSRLAAAPLARLTSQTDDVRLEQIAHNYRRLLRALPAL